MQKISFLLVIFLFSAISITAQTTEITQGTLYAMDKKGVQLGKSPLKHTKVYSDISGFLARVTVEQEFENNFNQPIEAVYTFPLSQNSAVDDMTMRIGSRIIRGKIKEREEAKKIYEKAKAQGKTASLLNQQRPNVFTQAVANILPNEKIVIEISYVETLKYRDGSYEFVFPMVVGPRYSPASMKKNQVARITPPIAKTRAGHDISIEVNIDAGVPIENISSTLHEINTQNLSSNSAKIELRKERIIPNKDFILKYDVTGKRIQDSILTHRTEGGGFFTMMLAPPEDVRVEDVSPKEIVFVLDTSGSMSGFPIEKAKEAMKMSIEGLYPNDTFNLITFAGNTRVLFEKPVPATPENLAKAKEFIESRRGGGGTEMMKAIQTALKASSSKEHIRIVNFMTDGYVSNESQIIAEIQKHPEARIFSFGIGNSVNRYLLDKMAEEGRGEVEYVSLKDDGSAAAKRFHERIRNPLLTDISIDWNGMPIANIYPKRNLDLFDAKPVVIHGRFTKAQSGTINLKGKVGKQLFERSIQVDFPEKEENHDVLATLWARTRISDLMSQMRLAKDEKARKELQETVTNLGIEFRLLTQYTAFVAVEEVVKTQGEKTMTVEVPVELPSGVSLAASQDSQYVNYYSYSSGRDPFRKAPYSRVRKTKHERAKIYNRNTTAMAGNRRSKLSLETDSLTNNQAVTVDTTDKIVKSGGVLNNIVKRINNHNKALQSLKADIKKTVFSSKLKVSETTEGSLNYLSKNRSRPNIRIEWGNPTKQYLVTRNGKYLVYKPKSKSAVIGEFYDDEFGYLIDLISFSKEKLRANFAIQYMGIKKVGKDSYWQLKLTPKKKIFYKNIELLIDRNGMTKEIKGTEENGNQMTLSLSNEKKNVPIKSSIFKLNLPKGTKIIQQ